MFGSSPRLVATRPLSDWERPTPRGCSAGNGWNHFFSNSGMFLMVEFRACVHAQHFHHTLTNATALHVFIIIVKYMLENLFCVLKVWLHQWHTNSEIYFVCLLFIRRKKKTKFLSSACVAKDVILLKHPFVSWTEQCACSMWLTLVIALTLTLIGDLRLILKSQMHHLSKDVFSTLYFKEIWSWAKVLVSEVTLHFNAFAIWKINISVPKLKNNTNRRTNMVLQKL